MLIYNKIRFLAKTHTVCISLSNHRLSLSCSRRCSSPHAKITFPASRIECFALASLRRDGFSAEMCTIPDGYSPGIICSCAAYPCTNIDASKHPSKFVFQEIILIGKLCTRTQLSEAFHVLLVGETFKTVITQDIGIGFSHLLVTQHMQNFKAQLVM